MERKARTVDADVSEVPGAGHGREGEAMSDTTRCEWPDRLWVWRDVQGTLQVTEGKPSREIASREYGRFLSKHDLFKLAEKEDGVDTGRYVNNLLRLVENQSREINRLRQTRPVFDHD